MERKVPVDKIRERGEGYENLSSRLGAPMKTWVAILLTLFLSGCHKPAPHPQEENVLLVMGDSVLTLQYVVDRIPVGLDASDSAVLFRRIVDSWVESMVLTDMAREKLSDMREIERKVNTYRNRLIVSEYLARKREEQPVKVNPDSVRRFYESHRGEMISETPLVKGIYIKVPEDISGLEELKKCVFTADDRSVDELERRWAGDALQYEYFESDWIDWVTLSEQIPYRFYEPDKFLSTTKNFETSRKGSVYLLHISDYLPSGSEIPYEFASSRIEALMEQANMASYEDALVKSLVTKAIKEGRLKSVLYDPVSHREKEWKFEKK